MGATQLDAEYANDRELDTIVCGRKGANCVVGVLCTGRVSPLKHVRVELHNPGDCDLLITVKHRNKSVFFAAKSWHIRQLPTKTLLFDPWRKH